MKNSIFYYLLVLLIVASCKEQPKEEKAETATVEISSPENTTFISECYSHEKVLRETAKISVKSWVYSSNHINKTNDTISPEIHFSRDSIMKLRPEGLTENKGVLIYYILKKKVDASTSAEDKIPSLAMVRTDQCNLFYGACKEYCALISWHNGHQEFMSKKKINDSLIVKYRKNWTDYLATLKEAVIPIEGYNYDWVLIDKLLKDTNEEIVIKYGVRTLGVGEYELLFEEEKEQEQKPEPVEIAVGLPILCNVIVGKLIDDTMDYVIGITNEYDFAKPCPQYCAQ